MIYAVGDIHGHLKKLNKLLPQLPLKTSDRLVFLGDYIDRGPDSCGVMDELIRLKIERPLTVFLRGNHEQMMLLARRRFDPNWDSDLSQPSFDVGSLWFAEGGAATLRSYAGALGQQSKRWWHAIPESHWRFVLETEFEFVTEQYHFVHAGLLPSGCTWQADGLQDDPRLWIREPFLSNVQCNFGGKVVVFGHTPQMSGNPYLRDNKVGIDTGAAFGGPLTAIALAEDRPVVKEIYQAR